MPDSPTKRIDPSEPLPPQAVEFSAKVHALLDGTGKDDATVEQALQGCEGMFDIIAAGLYTLASMLIGEGEESIQATETAVANAEVSACTEPEQARRSSRRALAEAALSVLRKRNPGSLVPPPDLQPGQTCIEEDDLSSTGISHQELEGMLSGPDRQRVRTWLEGLRTDVRVIFVLRAVAGFSSPDVAELLTRFGGPQASGWTADAVREVFRQGLCSLASQLIHAV